MNNLPILIRREFWEHRVLWVAPLAAAILYLATCLFLTRFRIGGVDFEMSGSPGWPSGLVVMLIVTQVVLTIGLAVVASLVAFYYLSDCLFAERKDRSILFWKSLPVSDSATVVSKLLVAMLVLPAGVVLLGLVTNALGFGILYARFHDSPFLQNMAWGNPGAWLYFNLLLLADVVIFGLWYSPIIGYQLLVSAWAKNATLAWTLLPPFFIILGEKLIFDTGHVGQLLGYRLVGFARGGDGFDLSASTMRGPEGLENILRDVNALPMLTWPDLWVGVLVAVVLVFGAVRIRRYRDDT